MNDHKADPLRHESTLAKFGEFALRSDDLDEILAEACRLAGEALGTHLAKVIELQADGETLIVRAGVGWKPGIVGFKTIAVSDDTSEGHALRTGEPMISPDIATETRFRYAPFLIENGVRAVANVLIIGRKGMPPFGILQIDSLEPRQFNADDTAFLQTYANLLAAAVDRFKVVREVKEGEERLRLALEGSRLGTWSFDIKTSLFTGSARYYEIFGYTEPPLLWSLDTLLSHIFSEDRDRVRRAFVEAVTNDSEYFLECRINPAHVSTIRWIEIRGRLHSSPVAIASLQMLGIVADVTERKQTEETLLRSNHALVVQTEQLLLSQMKLSQTSAAFSTTLNHMDQGLIMVGADGRVAVCNHRAMEILGLPADFMMAHPYYDDMVAHQWTSSESSNIAWIDTEENTGSEDCGKRLSSELRRPDGMVIEIQTTPLSGGGMVRTYTDITKRRVSSDLVNYFARHDALTKLVNRRVFEERLVAAIEASRGTGGNVALLYMDLDRFKAVNDTRGHSVGDRLLMEAAARMCSAVRNTDTVARMGGDEFAILQPLIPDVTAAEVLAQRLIQVVSKPYKIDGIPCLVGLSIGIAIFPKDSDDVGLLLRHADTALYRTKSDCRGTYLMFEDSMEGRQRELFEMEGDLRDAFQLNQLEIFYQPIVNSKTRKIVAFEALLRWQHKSGRDVSPHEFVPIAEMSGLIIPIGLWVLENACVEAASWHNELSIAVNLSPVQFRHGDLITQIKGVLERTGLPAQRLTLEITEGILLEGTQEVLTTMGRLQQLGVRFSLDDFGTEHAGLSYLCSFPFHSIKIDKSIVQHALIRKSAGAIVAAIIAMCKALDLTVIGEGVETEEQLALLCGLGCTQVQGFLTGSPRPGRENRDFL